MNYVNDRFCELVQLPRNRQAILAMKKDVDDFLPSFCDSPAKLSRWGHHYFCDDDGGRLIFDLNSPHSHRCEICGKVYPSLIHISPHTLPPTRAQVSRVITPTITRWFLLCSL